jgi:hypothetical protein
MTLLVEERHSESSLCPRAFRQAHVIQLLRFAILSQDLGELCFLALQHEGVVVNPIVPEDLTTPAAMARNEAIGILLATLLLTPHRNQLFGSAAMILTTSWATSSSSILTQWSATFSWIAAQSFQLHSQRSKSGTDLAENLGMLLEQF